MAYKTKNKSIVGKHGYVVFDSYTGRAVAFCATPREANEYVKARQFRGNTSLRVKRF